MAPKGRRGFAPLPWGAWLAFGVALVCSGGLPAVVWAGRCCWGWGPAAASFSHCGAVGVAYDHCNGQPTHREPTRGRLRVVGGVQQDQ